MKHIINLTKLVDIEENKYKKAVAAIKRVRQIADTKEYDDVRKAGLKLSAVALNEVLNEDVKIIGVDITEDEASNIRKQQSEENERKIEEAELQNNQVLEPIPEDYDITSGSDGIKTEKIKKTRKKRIIKPEEIEEENTEIVNSTNEITESTDDSDTE